MTEDPWTTLGIPPGAGPDAIRRAYAVRLKAIDVDADPAAFMRLREAFDAALEDESLPRVEAVFEERTDRHVAWPVEQPVPERAAVTPYGALDEANATFEGLIDARATREAAAFLERVLAQGIVPLGNADAFVRSLTACALADETLSADELAAIAATFHAAEVGERARALRWRANIQADAARGNGIRGRWARYTHARTRVARALLQGMTKHELFSGDLPALRIEVGLAARYARWFPDFLDVAKSENALVRLERTLRGQEILGVIVTALILAVLGFAQSSGWWK